jgi:hypothetical protein
MDRVGDWSWGRRRARCWRCCWCSCS